MKKIVKQLEEMTVVQFSGFSAKRKAELIKMICKSDDESSDESKSVDIALSFHMKR
jgi:hypothetical protein